MFAVEVNGKITMTDRPVTIRLHGEDEDVTNTLMFFDNNLSFRKYTKDAKGEITEDVTYLVSEGEIIRR